MRRLVLLALAIVIGSASLFAANGEDPITPKKEIRTEIMKLLETPDFVLTEDIDVVIKFTFSSEGEIVILCPGCKDKRITDYLRKNLNYKKFNTPGERDKIYKMPLKIKVS